MDVIQAINEQRAYRSLEPEKITKNLIRVLLILIFLRINRVDLLLISLLIL